MPNSEFEYCKDCVSHASCYRNSYCVDMLCKPAVTEENIKALQQDNAALQALLNKERDEWHTAFMRHNEEWQAKCDALTGQLALTSDVTKKVLDERDALYFEFRAFKSTAAELETSLRKERDELYRQREDWVIERSTLRTQLETAEIERDALQAQLAQQCTLEAVEAPATHVVNNYYGLDDERIRQMIRDELNATFNRYGHRS